MHPSMVGLPETMYVRVRETFEIDAGWNFTILFLIAGIWLEHFAADLDEIHLKE